MCWKLDDLFVIIKRMEYAIIKSGGKQYRVSKGDIIEVDKLLVDKDKDVTFDQVLLLCLNGTTKIGTPYLTGIEVMGRVLEQKKGEKIRVAKFKAKVRYRKSIGFRAMLTKVQITSLGASAQKTSLKPIKETVVKVKPAPKRIIKKPRV